MVPEEVVYHHPDLIDIGEATTMAVIVIKLFTQRVKCHMGSGIALLEANSARVDPILIFAGSGPVVDRSECR